jgi:hypothetical protein
VFLALDSGKNREPQVSLLYYLFYVSKVENSVLALGGVRRGFLGSEKP